MEKLPVGITGMGVLSAVGSSCAETLAGFRKGGHNPAAPAGFATDLDKPVFSVQENVQPYAPDDMRTLQLAFWAIDEALNDASYDLSNDTGRVGVCLGTTVASQLNDIDFYRTFRESGEAPMAAVDRYLRGNLAAAVAAKYGLSGPTLTVVNACSSGADAIGIGLSWLRAGVCDAVIAGGADELSRVTMSGFHALGVMSDAPCAPFDCDRRGLNLGEGAGIVVMETLAGAKRRGRDVRLTCNGYGTCGDAYHLTAPREDGSGLESAISYALEDAGVTPSDIGFVNAHGTATPTNDVVEGSVLAHVFGPDILVSATKGMTGHTLGAAGGIEAVLSLLGLREGWIPGSEGFVNRDPEIPLEPVRAVTPVSCSYAISTSLAFGGNNSALVFGRSACVLY